MSRSFSAELRFIYSQQNLQAIVGISKELAKLGAVEKMRGGCAEDSMFHFPRDGRTSSEEVGPGELLRFLGLTFFFFLFTFLVQSLLFLSHRMFYGAAIVFLWQPKL